ncbi:phosphoenolpyruvate carboxykinase (ATP) [Desulfosporosinus sp. BICA1-9]|uniref:phosphoenolpyruvate carboxykinase (ATP) n=1 Tax=Desulfosporosinus sp. BICA1-9 TaxID=1531958 RepID=UPI0005F13557|nr:phosphoenolpyruvate carboxykinase (ATP) [Desulfosporosinus sp. BICA1-9]KJS48544.1 MAG: phosphoenolpyruvate carboxykinase [Peptococcaceae bacterium BRH_c23]KJS89210.1 MAG: phosphoenolpyruvate carboxykinase [Desulfosporosinus sp. BICA1-9]HBW36889.1 phosphoenolpyruvate carboxykinase (ATP) [Desulfosporosinus sp.]
MDTSSRVNHLFAKKSPLGRNLPVSKLIEIALERKEGILSNTGALCCTTGNYTGRSPKDRFIVDEASVHDQIAWGSVNKSISPECFDNLYRRALDYLETKEYFVFDGFAGADAKYGIPIRVINEYAWHNIFVQQLFIRPTVDQLEEHQPEFTMICTPGLTADPGTDGTNSEAYIILSLEKKVIILGGTEYAGEMKKSIFSVLNYLMPFREVLPMHCSANVGADRDVALFFGLSGTGKTTLSADPQRNLIGDDEHGWSRNGVFNFEGGCYAKCINLSQEQEPQIWNAIRFGTVIENVIVNTDSREPDYSDNSLTENTRAGYPVTYIDKALIPGLAGHPSVVVFLTADAFGVLPPIAKLNKEQAMYHFLSGYTSKLAGTERGVTEPQVTFSTCFGEPFLPLNPAVYAEMLGSRIDEHHSKVYLVNTGWSGGPYGVGKRMNLAYTRAIITAALNGELEKVGYSPDPVFGILIPEEVTGVPVEILTPRNTWEDTEAYDKTAHSLAESFRQNFAKFRDVSADIRSAGP